MQHKFIRIFVIKSASFVIQKLAFFLHFFLDPACCLGIIRFHQRKLLLLYPFPVIKSGIGICYIEWKKSVVVHKFLLFFPLSIIVYALRSVVCVFSQKSGDFNRYCSRLL